MLRNCFFSLTRMQNEKTAHHRAAARCRDSYCITLWKEIIITKRFPRKVTRKQATKEGLGEKN